MAAFDKIEGGPVDRGTFARFRDSIDSAWILEALTASGTASIRRRRFPAEQVIWLVLGMALFRDLPIVEVVNELGLVLPDSGKNRIAPSAIMKARARLGSSPMRWLFEKCSEVWAHASARKRSWRGLSLYGIDGTTVRVPDSPENRAKLGSGNAGKRGYSGYPLVRMVTLMALRSHLLVAARFGAFKTSERKYAGELWSQIPDNSLTVVDRNFVYAKDMIPLHAQGTNRHWLSRARKNMKWRVVERLGKGDELVEIMVNRASRKAVPSLPERWNMRAIKYKRRGFREQRLLTSLVNPKEYPASELVQLYHERWELELGFDEVKTEMLEREESIRSRSPEGVEQELWGLLLAYNLVRLEMERAADLAGVPPVQMSFVACLRAIRMDLIRFVFGSPGKLPKRVEALRQELATYVLPPRRSERRYPRAVKIEMSNYPRKRTRATGGRKRAFAK